MDWPEACACSCLWYHSQVGVRPLPSRIELQRAFRDMSRGAGVLRWPDVQAALRPRLKVLSTPCGVPGRVDSEEEQGVGVTTFADVLDPKRAHTQKGGVRVDGVHRVIAVGRRSGSAVLVVRVSHADGAGTTPHRIARRHW